ncbi:MAG TPA: site-2 protease family protein [Pyrinomonadaceae bacterium]|nr:site-2 protease family protein [Pyrinomonadaceae bacterium]
MSESVSSIPRFVPRAEVSRDAGASPTAREWARHAALFFVTALTVTWAGLVLLIPSGEVPEPTVAEPSTIFGYFLFVPTYYVQWMAALWSYALAHPAYLAKGATFAAALLAILLAHEAGHYVACRRYGVRATLPFFIPVPPPFLLGTFGAFIKIKSPIPSRRALFDIGVAGPLAGFAVLVPVALLALWTATPETRPLPTEGVLLFFNDPPLLRLLAGVMGVEDLPNIAPNPFHIAAWVGLLVTSLNLIPVGQLDGGHAIYALFGAKAHRRTGLAAFALMLLLAPLGWLWHGAPSGFVYAALLLVMLRVRHPAAGHETEQLGRARFYVAALTLLAFLLSFTPFPITVR